MTPASAYPTSSAVRSDDCTRLFARTKSFSGTRFGMIACFAGLKNVLPIDMRNTATNTPGSQRRAQKGIVIVKTALATSARTITR